MKRALISDIHGNLEALIAVLEHIRTQDVAETLCLGDMIGYGPNPCECLDLVMETCRVTILGNHDQAALFDPDKFNPVALQAIYWTRDQLELGAPAKVNRRWDFLGELPRVYRQPNFLFVHGSPREPTNEYVFPESAYNARMMESLFSRVEKYCFQGHTHIPGVFTTEPHFTAPEELGYLYHLRDEKVMINIGSVGQPRDGDPRACYVTVDDATGEVRFHRVEYPFEVTRQKIYDVPDLNNGLGDRLVDGR